MSENQKQTYIGNHPHDGREWDCQCARCGSSLESEPCDDCEDGYCEHDCGEDCCCCEFPEPNMVCDTCRGRGVWWQCLSSPEWCQANPLPGRELMARSVPEWFPLEAVR